MFYRIRINLAFSQELPPGRIKELARTLLPNAITINPGQSNQERGYITLEKCYHDEAPTRPCETLEHHEAPL